MIYRVRHVTHYEYEKPVSLCYNMAYLLPRSTPYQNCLTSQIRINPSQSQGRRRTDYFGNTVYHFSLEQPHSELVVDVTSEVLILDSKYARNLELDLEFGVTCGQALVQLQQSRDPELLEAREFVLDSPLVRAAPELRDYARHSFGRDRPLLSAVRELTRRIYTDFTYDPESTTVATPLSDVLKKRAGVCQDFAHLAIGCLRSLGFPARYISGYLETQPPPGQEKLVGSDASHAWFAVLLPGEGWLEFDPTNDKMPAEHHITTAWGRDYGDVSPLKGVFFDGGESQKLKVSVDVENLQGQMPLAGTY
ncbi:transglutaminase family protein [Motiliproteus sp. SC1-56]|uniref:transglutaminase family protein n=1 Tax=Motiliproteus sp. SC1-56 TaxID=2799565 RepID=UPI001A90048E|nr:transglutaminase family protein [Motiliproteus sp. SC1-56]